MSGPWTVRRDTTLRGPQWIITDPQGRDICVAATQRSAIHEMTLRTRARRTP